MNIKKEQQIISSILFAIALLGSQISESQTKSIDNGGVLSQDIEEGSRVISTGVPVLLIAPDSRAGAMGDIGAATTPDANSLHWNAAKLAFIEKKSGVSFTYTPWLRNIVGDIGLSYLSGFYKVNDRSAVGASLTYFSLGNIEFYDADGTSKGNF